MLVKFPREVTGKELIEAVQRAAEILRVNGYVLESDTEERYEPGSVKRSINSMVVRICKLTKKVKRKRFLWLKQDAVEVPGYPLFEFPELFSDDKYKELDIMTIKAIYGGHPLLPITVVEYNNKTFDEIRPVFEKLVAGIYKELTPVALNN